MKAAPYNMLLEAASRYNILTLTTSCAAACVFCSHHQNPGEVEAYYVNKLTKEEAENLVEFLDKNSKVTIGESATRICEGEPFAFEYIIDILKLIRSKFSSTPIQITTSGIYLDEAVLKELEAIQNIELNVSLNSSTEEGRSKLYGGKSHMQGVAALGLLKHYGIRFNGSIVAMPHVVGWEDLEQTILYLAEQGAASIRVFMPGYTRYTRIALPEQNINNALRELVLRLRGNISTPIILEPAVIDSLDARVEGVIPSSPASLTGLQVGDTVLSVSGKAVYSRVDAYNRLYKASNPKVSCERAGRPLEYTIEKSKNSSSGLVFNYDIASEAADRIKSKVGKLNAKKCLMLVSELGYGIMSRVLEGCTAVSIRAVKNNYFGGNIQCAGLLVLQDIADVLRQLEEMPEVVFLSQIMFDEKGRDLIGRHYLELEQEFGVAIVVI